MSTVPTAVPVITSAAALATGYYLGHLACLPRLGDRLAGLLHRAHRHVHRHGQASLLYYPAQVVYAAMLAADFCRDPQATRDHIRLIKRIRPQNLPDELIDAVAEAARLHLPLRHRAYEYASFAYLSSTSAALDNVAFVPADPADDNDVDRLTLGIHGGRLGDTVSEIPGMATKEELLASKARVRAALASLGPLAAGVRVRVPLVRP